MPKRKIALIKHGKGETLDSWYGWCDGLFGALTELAKDITVTVFGYSDQDTTLLREGIEIKLFTSENGMRRWLDSYQPHIILGWGTSFHNWQELDYNGVPGKKILLYAGGTPDDTNASKLFDLVVVENESDKKFFKRSEVAFGTNTKVFRPLDLNKVYPAFYPAAFALYKRHNLWAKSVPDGSLAVGQMQDHETECFEVVTENGHIISPPLSMNSMPFFYNQSFATVLTPEHLGGCQRAALESMACNIPVLATNDSKASEFEGVWSCDPNVQEISNAYLTMVTEFEQNPINLREEYVVGKYDHIKYAEKLKALL